MKKMKEHVLWFMIFFMLIFVGCNQQMNTEDTEEEIITYEGLEDA